MEYPMNKPTTKNRINLRCNRRGTVIIVENIVGVIEYPLAIHRSVDEHEDILDGRRKRYSDRWNITHLPTGKGLGIKTSDWESIIGYVKDIGEHPCLLMMTDETMTQHPMYRDLVDKHSEARKKWRL